MATIACYGCHREIRADCALCIECAGHLAPLPENVVRQQIAALEAWALGCQDIERRKAGAD